MPKVYKKVSGSWVPVKSIYKKVSGSWVRVKKVYKKVSNAWVVVFTGKTYISQTVTLSKSTNATTDLVTLTGTNYYWDPAPSSLTYEFRKTGVGVVATGTAQNPPVGSSNTYTFTISQASNIITPNQANEFTFAIIAAYAGPDETSISGSQTVQGPRDITVSSGTIGTNSIQVTWTTSTYANRYKVEYKLSTDTTYTFHSGVASSPVTVSGLEMNKTYNFRITPYTGNSNSGSSFTGYPGNHAWLTETTKELYTVNWNANGGTTSPTSSTQSDVGASVSVPTPTRTNYRFDGWFLAAGSSTMVLSPTDTTYTPTANITLYAHWTRMYTITYDINGGTGSVPSPQTGVDGEVINLSFSPIPTIANGAWKGWDESSTALASNAQYSNLGYPYPGVTTLTLTKDVTLYAIYLMTAPPTNTIKPSISVTTAYIGQTVTSDGGSWTSNTKSYEYQWQYNAGGTWTNSTGTGATTLNYTVNGFDIYTSGSNIRLKVTAWTGTTAGTGVSAIAYSDPIAVYATGTCSISQVSGTNNYSITNTYSSNIYRTDYLVTSTASGVGNNFANGSTSNTYNWTNYATPTQSGSASTVTVTTSDKYIYALQLVYDSNTGRYYKSNQASYGPTVALSTVPTPTFDANTSTGTGFTGQVNNYQGSNYTYSFSTSAGTVTPGTPNSFNSTYPFTVTGLSSGQSATVTVTASRSGWISSQGQTTGQALTADNKLSSLTISSGTLSPSFSSTTTSYTVNVSNSVSSVTVTPTASSANSTITVNGSSVTSGSASQSISLTAGGTTTINIVVTGSDGVTKTYSIVVSRNQAAISITLSSPTNNSSGFTFTLTSTYDSSWTWTASINGSPAGVSITPATGSSTGQTYTVTGMGPLTVTSATATVSATKTGYDPASASVTGTAVTPTISSWAISNITAAAPVPSALSVVNSATNNVGSCTWTNGAGTDRAWMSSITGSGSGAQTDNGTARTSATFTITSTGNATATVTNVALGRARISWNQSNVQSYVLQYSVAGSTVSSGIVNNSSSTVNYDLLSNGLAITLVSLTVYPNQNGGGTGVPGVVPATKSVTPSNQTGTASKTGYVIYSAAPHFPPFFPPHFPPFFPPHFPPFFPPYFPPGPFFPPYFAACIDEDTLVAVVGENDEMVYKPAKEIKLGDKVWSTKWDGLEDERNVDPYTWHSDSLNNIVLSKTNIVNIISSVKDVTIIINNEMEKRFSLEQTVLLNRNGRYFFGTTGTLEVGDILLEKTINNQFIEIPIKSLDIIDEQRTVYQFDAEPRDTLIAGNLIVHNAKGFA